MLPDRVSNPGPLTYESGALPTALCGLALDKREYLVIIRDNLCPFCIKPNVVTPHLNRLNKLNGSDEGSQHIWFG